MSEKCQERKSASGIETKRQVIREFRQGADLSRISPQSHAAYTARDILETRNTERRIDRLQAGS